MNKKQQNPEHQHSTHSGPHQEDNCGGCQVEKQQNRRLVEFYERLQKMQNKVGVIKQNINCQQIARSRQKQQVSKIEDQLVNSPEKALQQIRQKNPKQMGYQLASALIERQIKAKAEQQRLHDIIQQLQKDKLRLESDNKAMNLSKVKQSSSPALDNPEPTANFSQKEAPSRYEDVLDEVRRTNSIDSAYFTGKKKTKMTMNNSYFVDNDEYKKYWETSEDQGETSFSIFSISTKQQQPTIRTSEKSEYDGLNLWLYQYKAENLDLNPIKSLRRPSGSIQKHALGKYKSKF